MSLILSLSLAWLINQVKPSQVKPSSSFLAFPRAQTQTLFLGLSWAWAKLELLNFPSKPNLNMHYSTKFSSFTILHLAHKIKIYGFKCGPMVHVSSIYIRQLGDYQKSQLEVSLKLIQMQKSSGAADDNINHSFKDIFVSALKIYQQLYCKIIFVFASLI